MSEDLIWFFGYGSLMWNPGFAHAAFEAAELDGWQRRFCIVSRHYRGTPDTPGLVLGLTPGGTCVGRAIGVQPGQAADVLAYLDAREHVGGIYVYERRRLSVRLLAGNRSVQAWCYLSLPDHPDHSDGLDDQQIGAIIAAAAGVAGTNAAYAINTVQHLRKLGIVEPALETLVSRLDAKTQQDPDH